MSTFRINKLYFLELILFFKKKFEKITKIIQLITNQSEVQEMDLKGDGRNRHMYFKVILPSAPQVLL